MFAHLRIPRPYSKSRAAAAIAAAVLFTAASQAQTTSLEHRFQEWKLNAATGAPSAAGLTELKALANEAKMGAPSPLATAISSEFSALETRLKAPQESEPNNASGVRSQAESKVLRVALEKAIADDNGVFIRSLGRRAVPILTQLARQWDGSPTTGDVKPALSWLSWIDPAAALDVALDRMASPVFLVKRSTLQALTATSAFHSEAIWVQTDASNWRLANSEWERILTLALSEPAVEPDALRTQLDAFARRGQLPRSLADVAVGAITKLTSPRIEPREGIWLLEALLASPVKEVRIQAARRLFLAREGGRVARLAYDPDEDVRRKVAEGLLQHAVNFNRKLMPAHLDGLPEHTEVTNPVFDAWLLLALEGGSVTSRIKMNLGRRLVVDPDPIFSADQLIAAFAQIHDSVIRGNLLRALKRLPEAPMRAALPSIAESAAGLPEDIGEAALRQLCDRDLFAEADHLLDLFESEAAPMQMRAWAGVELAATRPPVLVPSMANFAADIYTSPVGQRDAAKFIGSFGYETKTWGPYLRAIIQHPQATPEFLLELSVLELENDTIDALFKRLPPEGWADLNLDDARLGSAAVRGLARLSSSGLDPRLTRINFGVGDLLDTLITEALERRPAPLQALLEDRLHTAIVAGSAGHAWNLGLDAVGGYMNEEAVAWLLSVAKLPMYHGSTERAMMHIGRITQWREAAAAWERSSGAASKRADAIAELVALLDDSTQGVETRAAALRGLGVLKAAEELPRIVRAIASDEAPIQAAARAALKRLESDSE